jgi:hypothetical protein
MIQQVFKFILSFCFLAERTRRLKRISADFECSQDDSC